MKDNRSAPSGDRAASEPERHAAAWFVSLDAGNPHSDADREFAKWIDGDIGREAEFARCEAAFCLVDRLRSDPEMRWAFEEIEPLLASDAFARRRAALRRWLSAPRALVATAASVVLMMLGASVFSILRTESFPVGSLSPSNMLGDTPASEDDRWEGEASLPRTDASAQELDELLEGVDSSRMPAHFDQFPLDALVVRILIFVDEPTSPKSRLLVEMPDGTVGYASVGDYLGQEDVRIVEITRDAVVLEDGRRIALMGR